jgi:hypothetical protein
LFVIDSVNKPKVARFEAGRMGLPEIAQGGETDSFDAKENHGVVTTEKRVESEVEPRK